MTTIEIEQFQGIIILPRSQYRIYAPRKAYPSTCEPAECVEHGAGVDQAVTSGIKSCLGFKAEDKYCAMLVHAYSPSNLDVVLEAMIPLWSQYVARTPKIHLASRRYSQERTYADLRKYDSVLQRYFPTSARCWHPIESHTLLRAAAPSREISALNDALQACQHYSRQNITLG